MWVGKWCWLVPMVVLIAGCLPQPAPTLPDSFLQQIGTGGVAVQAASVPLGLVDDVDVVAALRADGASPMFRSRAVPVFVEARCTRTERCVWPGGQDWRTRPLWVVVYPEWVGVDGEVGWVMVDAATGVESGYTYIDPLEP